MVNVATTTNGAGGVIDMYRALLGSRLVARYDAKSAGVVVDANGMVQQLTDLSGNGHHLVQNTAANRPVWDFENRISFTAASQQYLINTSIISAIQNNTVGVYGIFQSTSSDVFLVNFCDPAGTAFFGLRNSTTLLWGGTGNNGNSGIAMNRDNLQQVIGMQVTRNTDLQVMEDLTITTVADATIATPTDYPTVSNFSIGARILATPAYLNLFMESLVITAGALTTAELQTLATYITGAQRSYNKILVVELGQSNMEGRDGDLTHPRYPFQTNTGLEFNGSTEVFIKTTRAGAAAQRGSHANYFCEKYFSLTGKQPVMIECATGSTGLTSTATTPNWSSGSTLRSGAEASISAALSFYSRTKPDFALWCQGESDAEEMNVNAAYTKAIVKTAMQDVINWWKTTYPGVPFIISELGVYNTGHDAAWNTMRDIQNEIVAENPGVAYMGYQGAKNFLTDSTGMFDIFHYNFAGYKKMGEALATYIATNF